MDLFKFKEKTYGALISRVSKTIRDPYQSGYSQSSYNLCIAHKWPNTYVKYYKSHRTSVCRHARKNYIQRRVETQISFHVLSSLIRAFFIHKYVPVQRKPWSDCANEKADLGLQWLAHFALSSSIIEPSHRIMWLRVNNMESEMPWSDI